MGEILGAIISTVFSMIINLMILSTFFSGDQLTSFHQSVREAGRAGANYPAPSFDPSATGTSMISDQNMIDEPYLTFKAAFLNSVPHGKIDSLDYSPVSLLNPEDVQITATVEIPRFLPNVLNLIGGPSFSSTIKQTFTVTYYREWDYSAAISSGAINPSTNGPAQSH